VLLIINDRADIARLCDADGLHLGQGDMAPVQARKILGANKIIGLSTHSHAQVKVASNNRDVDYIGIGPVFKTDTKPGMRPVGLGLLSKAAKATDMPFYAIGGIGLKNIKRVLSAGAVRVAVSKAVFGSANPQKIVKRLKGALNDID